jgi:drug/metabolite transporter (DMT)-like permease
MSLQKKYRLLLADIGLVYAAAVWGSTFVLVKRTLADVHPLMLVAWRFLSAAALLKLLLSLRLRPCRLSSGRGTLLGIVLWLIYVPQTLGLQFISASNSAFITGLFIVFVPFFGKVFFNINPRRKELLAVLIGVAGLFVLTGGLRGLNAGDGLTLLGSICYALHVLLTDRYMKAGEDPYELCVQQFLFVGLLSVLFGLCFGLPLAVRSRSAAGAIVFLAVFPTASAFVVQNLAQQHTAPVRAALLFTLEPVFAALFAWTVGGEPFTFHSAAGGALIVAAMMVSAVPDRRTGCGVVVADGIR